MLYFSNTQHRSAKLKDAMDQYYASGLEQGKHPACHSITSGKWKKGVGKKDFSPLLAWWTNGWYNHTMPDVIATP